MESTYELLVGIDWATERHQICLLQADGSTRQECAVEHSFPQLHSFVQRLLGRVDGQAERIAVAIETPRGALVESLVEYGLHVYALNPKQLDRFRDRHSVAGAKDDRLDAYVLADALRTDLPKFRRVTLDDPLVLQIRELARVDDDLRTEFNRLNNRFREQLYRAAAPLLQLSPTADEPWLWDLTERLLKRPERRPTRSQIAQLLRRHRIRRLTAEQVLDALHQPTLRSAPGALLAVGLHINLLLPHLRLVHQQRHQCRKHLERLLDEYSPGPSSEDHHPTLVQILRSLPGVGTLVASTLLAEAAHPLHHKDYPALRAYGGIAPITRRSGKTRLVFMRQACDTRLRNAFYHWARTSIQSDTAAHHYYTTLRGRGHTHGRALRSVADRWLRILVAMLTDHTLYQPGLTRHPSLTAP